MRKLLVIMTILMLALTSLVGVATATPVDELTSLAQYAPEGAPAFAVMRTDDGYIETLDGLLNRVTSAVGEESVSVTDLINEALQGLPSTATDPNYDFATDIRPWLGDFAALLITQIDMEAEMSDTPPGSAVVALSVSDHAAAEAWLEDYTTNYISGWAERVETEDGILYEMQNSGDASFLLSDGVLFIGLAPSFDTLVMPDDDLVNLAQTTEFQDVVAALPLDDYNALVYLDGETLATQLAPLYQTALAQTPEGRQALGMMGMYGMGNMEEMASMVGQQAMGFTLLEGRSLVMDYAVAGDDMEDDQNPVDLAILERVPADTILAVVNQGAGDMVNEFLASLETLDTMMTEEGMTASEMGDLPPNFDVLNFHSIAVFLRQMYEGTTGLNLDETLELLNGTSATFVSINPQEVDGLTVPVPSPAVIFQTDNAEGSAAYIEAMANIVTDIFAYATFEDGVLTIPANELGLDFPPEVEPLAAFLDTQLASNDEVIAFGAIEAVQYALDPQGDNLTDTGTYGYEAGLFLPEPTTLFLINVPPVVDPLIQFLTDGEMAPQSDIEMLESLLHIVATASITTGNDNARFTITLTE